MHYFDFRYYLSFRHTEILNISTQIKNLKKLLKNATRLTAGKIFFINKDHQFFKNFAKILIIFAILLGISGFNATAQAKILDNLNFLDNLNIGLINNNSEGQGGPPDSSSSGFLKLASIFKFLSFNLGGEESNEQDLAASENQGSDGILQGPAFNNQKVIYKVKEGDTLIKIAQEFGISVNTIIWANKIKNPKLIKPGDELIILPIDGVEYTVKNGDTLLSIAKRFRGDVEEIITFNNLPSDGTILPGQEIVIPDGELPQISSPQPSLPPQIYQNSNWVQVGNGYFIMPTVGKNWGIKHANNGVDISNSCGTPVKAAADGEVIYVSFTPSTWRYANSGYGNNIRILHPNGTITLYAHLLYGSEMVRVGDIVNQNQIIALMGGKPRTAGAGNTSGCHLHFEVRGGKNPFVWR